jgi:hypothetical protein
VTKNVSWQCGAFQNGAKKEEKEVLDSSSYEE